MTINLYDISFYKFKLILDKMKKRILVLNPPTRDGDYINRDQMGGMGQKISFGKTFLTKVLRDLKSSFIHQPVLQLAYAATILNKENEKIF